MVSLPLESERQCAPGKHVAWLLTELGTGTRLGVKSGMWQLGTEPGGMGPRGLQSLSERVAGDEESLGQPVPQRQLGPW